MIKQEYPYIDGEGKEHEDLIRTYSDIGLDLIQVETAVIYGSEVIDTYPLRWTYIEKPAEPKELPAVDK